MSGGAANTNPENSLGGVRSQVMPRQQVTAIVDSGLILPGATFVNAFIREDSGSTRSVRVYSEYESGNSEWLLYVDIGLSGYEPAVAVPDDGQVHRVTLSQSGTGGTVEAIVLDVDTTQLVDDGGTFYQCALRSVYDQDIPENNRVHGGLITATKTKFIKPTSFNPPYPGFPFNQIRGVTHVDAHGVAVSSPDMEDDFPSYQLYVSGSTLRLTLYYNWGTENTPFQTISSTGFYYFYTVNGGVMLHINADEFGAQSENRSYSVYLTANTDTGYRAIPANRWPSSGSTPVFWLETKAVYYLQNVSSSAKTAVAYLRGLPVGCSLVALRSLPAWVGDGISTGVVPEGYNDQSYTNATTEDTVDDELHEFAEETPAGLCSGMMLYLRLVPPAPADSLSKLSLGFGVAP